MLDRPSRGHQVTPRSTREIRGIAHGIKDVLREQVVPKQFHSRLMQPNLPIIWLVELLHDKTLLELHIVEESHMQGQYGLTYPAKSEIFIREDIYNKAMNGCGFSRLTIAHELGHWILHQGESVRFHRDTPRNHKTFEDSEWQADKFAQEFLIDTRFLPLINDHYDISSHCGVTPKAASVAYRALAKEGIIQR